MLIVFAVFPVASPTESMLLEQPYCEVVAVQFHWYVLALSTIVGIFPGGCRLYPVAFYVRIVEGIDVDGESETML